MTRRLELIWRTPEYAAINKLTITPTRVTVKVPYACPEGLAVEYLNEAFTIAHTVPHDAPSLRNENWTPGSTQVPLHKGKRGVVWGVYDAETRTTERQEDA